MRKLAFRDFRVLDNAEHMLHVALDSIRRFSGSAEPTAVHQGFVRQCLSRMGVSDQESSILARNPELALRWLDKRTSREDVEDVIFARYPASHPLRRDLADLADQVGRHGRGAIADRCEADEEGLVWLSFFLPHVRAGVREGDYIAAGVAFVGDLNTGGCAVHARAVRMACTNGNVAPLDEVFADGHFQRTPEGEARGSLEAAVRKGFSRMLADTTARALRPLTEMRAPNPVLSLAFLGIDVEVEDAVLTAFQEDGDATYYSAFNAITRAARDAQTVRQRLRLEQLAGRAISTLLEDHHERVGETARRSRDDESRLVRGCASILGDSDDVVARQTL